MREEKKGERKRGTGKEEMEMAKRRKGWEAGKGGRETWHELPSRVWS